MSWTYSGDPTTSKRDEVRFIVGDTDGSDQLVQDEELDYLIGKYGDPHMAAAEAARSIAAKLARLADKQVGDLQIKLSQKASHYANLASVILGGAGGVSSAPMPSAGGIDDEPFFTRRVHDQSGVSLPARERWIVG